VRKGWYKLREPGAQLAQNVQVSRGKGGFGEKIIIIFFAFLTLLFILPLYYVLLVSFNADGSNTPKILYLIPMKLDFTSYKIILQTKVMIYAFFNSVIITVLGTALSILLTTCAAYALSKSFPGKKVILYGFLFTMFFNGGMIPYYLTVKGLGLINTLAVMIIPTAINTFYLILMLSYFRTVPQALEESAQVDGANDIGILFKIVIPISMPTIAAITLFYAVDRWNEWFSAMLFINQIHLYPLQYLLRETLMQVQILTQSSGSGQMAAALVQTTSISIQMAVVVIASIPILLVYPFLQKYFTAGIMIGSVKE
jgi:putative aldouronate transport system permease protein